MSKQGKKGLVPELRFPEFSGEVVWKQKRLNKISEIVMGASPKSSAYNDVGIGLPLLQGNADIKNKLSAPRVFTSQVTKECRVNDILLSVRAPVGTVAKSSHNACIGRGLSAIRAVNDNSQEFIYQWLLHFEPFWGNISQGGTFDAVNSDDIRHLLVPIPRKDEQQKVADCLSSLDELIAAHTQKYQALQSHKKGLMQSLFPAVGEALPALRFPEFKEKGSWKNQKISDLLVRASNPVDVDPRQNYREIGIRSHGKGVFHKDAVSGKKLGNKRVFWVEEDAFVVNIVFAWELAVANTAREEQGMIASHRFPMYFPKNNKSNTKYMKYFFLTHKGKELLWIASPGGAGRNKTLSQKDFDNLDLLIPDVKEQKKIADCLSSLDDLITIQAQEIENLKTHKKGLMQQLFPSIDEVGA